MNENENELDVINNPSIVVFCGNKQSGKSSSAKFICGNEMLRIGIIDNVNVMENGDVGSTISDGRQILFDFDSKSSESMSFFDKRVWPTVRKFSFADKLKLSVNHIFGISLELMYGTDEEKNTKTKVKFKDFFGIIDIGTINTVKKNTSPEDFITIRQVLQFFGTNVCRRIYDRCWIDGLINDIKSYNSKLSLVDDCRFKNEVYALKDVGAKLIKLDRSTSADSHSSEKDLDDIDESVFDLVVPNSKMTLLEKNEFIMNWLQDTGIISKSYKDNGIIKAKIG